MSEASKTPDAYELIERFATRLVRQPELPPPLPADYFSPSQIKHRLMAALAEQKTAYHRGAYATQATICYAFLEQPHYTSTQLATATGISMHTVSRVCTMLYDKGLLDFKPNGRWGFWCLSPEGEQWLLKAAKGVTAQEGSEKPAEATGAKP